jgi:NTE family protein
MRKLLRLIDPGWSKQGLNVQGERLRKRLAKILGGSPEIEELEHPLAVVTTEMQSGRRFVIDRGPVIDAVRSTISIPMLFEPVQREGLVLADGGLLENLPVRAARELFGGPVIGVDVLPDFASNALGGDPTHDPIRTKRLPRRINDAMHAITVMMQSNTQLLIDVSRPELVLRPELPRNVTVLSGWSKASQLIAAGRSAAEAALPQLRELAKR